MALRFPLPRPLPWRPVPFAIALGGLLAWRSSPGPSANRSEALVGALAREGLTATAGDVAWVDPPPHGALGGLVASSRAIVRASAKGDPADLYLVRTRLSPEGVLLDVGGVYDLTRTIGADEGRPLLDGDHAIYASSVDGITMSVHELDLSGEPHEATRDFGRLARLENAITNLQETGQSAGVGRRGWSLDPSATTVKLEVAPDTLSIDADGRAIRIALGDGGALEGGAFVRPQEYPKARPGNLVTWAVDRVRNLSWFGDDRMQTLKAVAFAALDLFERARGAVREDSSAKEIAQDLGDLTSRTPVTYTDPETGWPPPPMKPVLHPPLPGEGEWVLLEHDPFVQTNPGAPPAFATSFIRTDHERKYTRIYVTVWDPRQVEMHMMAGTVEPVGATGEAGPGLIPRTPEVMRRVVAAMNGGFQAMHGEFGMMGDGVVYLPPKPFAATVAELRDGTTGFGEWPRETDIPDDILSYRQNLTALVLDEKFNPYGRNWWGGTPPGWHDKTHTVRTGICLTRERFVAYFYGNEIDAEVLADAMIAARCSFGIHLDMNAGHSGLEFYRVAPAKEFTPFGRPFQGDWEAEGNVDGLDGWKFRGRRMIRGMGLMNFPRYIHREGRDFFYLTLRHVLPGPDVAVDHAAPGEGHWTTKGLPQHGFPYALATTWVRADDAHPDRRIRLLALDPRAVRAAGAPGVPANAPTVVVLGGVARGKPEQPALFLGNGAFEIATEPPEHATQLLSGLAPNAPAAPRAEAAVGVVDDGNTLVYAELAGPSFDGSGAALDRLLARIGCGTRMLLPRALRPALGGTTGLGGEPAAPPDGPTVRLVRGEAPGARRIFEDTPIVPIGEWQPLQMQRIRYFKKPHPPAPAASAASP